MLGFLSKYCSLHSELYQTSLACLPSTSCPAAGRRGCRGPGRGRPSRCSCRRGTTPPSSWWPLCPLTWPRCPCCPLWRPWSHCTSVSVLGPCLGWCGPAPWLAHSLYNVISRPRLLSSLSSSSSYFLSFIKFVGAGVGAGAALVSAGRRVTSVKLSKRSEVNYKL